MIDFHTHSLLSDGELLPSELARRAEARGYLALGMADHVDCSNADFVVPRLAKACRNLRRAMDLDLFAGAEVTHVPPEDISSIVRRCRRLGAEYIIVHGETTAEPVMEGTNDAAIMAGADILAHPGLITLSQAREAARRGIFLELSGRSGHCLSNGNVARLAIEAGARLIISSDAHSPGDLLSMESAVIVARGAGVVGAELKKILDNARELMGIIKKRRR